MLAQCWPTAGPLIAHCLPCLSKVCLKFVEGQGVSSWYPVGHGPGLKFKARQSQWQKIHVDKFWIISGFYSLVLVQDLPRPHILWCICNFGEMLYLVKRWPNFGFPRVLRLSTFCPPTVWPDAEFENSQIQVLTRLCLLIFQSFLTKSEVKKRT